MPKFVLIWPISTLPSGAPRYEGRGFDTAEEVYNHEASCFVGAFVIVNGTVYDTKDINQAIADSEVS